MRPQLTVRRLATIAWRYKFRLGGIVAACVMLAIIATLVMPVRYRAEGQILVKIGRELMARSEVSTSQVIQPVIDADRILASNVELLSGRDVLWEALRHVGPVRIFPELAEDAPPSIGARIREAINSLLGREPPTDAAQSDGSAALLRQFRRYLSIGTIKQTNVITVSFDHESQEVAADVVNAVLEAFSAKAAFVFSQGSATLMAAQLQDEQRRVAEVEAELLNFRTESGLFNAQDQTVRLLARQQELSGGLQSADTRIAELQRRIGTLREQMAATPQTVELYEETDRFKIIDETNAQLLQLRLREQEMATHFQNTHPPLLALRRQIRTATQFLREQERLITGRTKTGINETWRNLQVSLLAAEADYTAEMARRTSIEGQYTRVAGELSAMTDAQHRLGVLERNLRIAEGTVRLAAQRLDDARALDDLNSKRSGSFEVVQQAVARDGADPVQPKPMIYLALSLVIGFMLAAGVAVLTSLSDDTLSTPEEAEDQLEVPNLAVVALRRAS